jgi:hypothetical protein
MVKPMSFNRRGGPDRRNDRPPHRGPGGHGQPRDDRGGDRPSYPPRDRGPQDARGFEPRGDRPYQPRGGDRPYPPRGGDRPNYPPREGDRPFTPRPRFDRPPDEGGMSIRLDPRRLGTLKHLAGEAGVRPGDLVRQWVEERIDAARTGAGGRSMAEIVESLVERVSALEASLGLSPDEPAAAPSIAQLNPEPEPQPDEARAEPVAHTVDAPDAAADAPAEERETAPTGRARRRTAVSAAPRERVALHDEMIAVLRERGPMTAGDLAAAVSERGRYAPPRSGKPLSAAMVSQRVSNPTYRTRFVRAEGRIGLAEEG